MLKLKEGVGLYRDINGLAVCSASSKQIDKTKQEIYKVFEANNNININITTETNKKIVHFLENQGLLNREVTD